MNYALIFAGGTGQRMNNQMRPKQFLELYGKPVIVYTLEQFQYHGEIDGIVVACLSEWIGFLEELVERYGLTKVVRIVPGGETGQDSIYNGLVAVGEVTGGNPLVLIHDGVRPLVDAATISACIACARDHGNAVTVVPATETIVTQQDGVVQGVIERKDACHARAPQCFMLDDIMAAHDACRRQGSNDYIDSASLMQGCGHQLFTVEGSPANIKITTPTDFYLFRALVDERENSQIFGVG